MENPDQRPARRVRAKVMLAVTVGAMLVAIALLIYLFGERPPPAPLSPAPLSDPAAQR